MTRLLLLSQLESTACVALPCGDVAQKHTQTVFMPNSTAPTAPSWHIQEWMERKHKKQADIVRELDWERGLTSKVINGKQAFTRDDLLALSEWLGIEPYELLMSPSRADQIRAIEESAMTLAATIQRHSVVSPPDQIAPVGAPRTAQREPRKQVTGRR
jgi:plasmid maintenance system antidote protein VapI